MAEVLFVVGLVDGAWCWVSGRTARGELKNGVLLTPFYWLVAAAVARYLGW